MGGASLRNGAIEAGLTNVDHPIYKIGEKTYCFIGQCYIIPWVVTTIGERFLLRYGSQLFIEQSLISHLKHRLRSVK